MPKSISIILFAVAGGLFCGCATTFKTQLDRLYETNFQGMDVPTPNAIKAEGVVRNYSHASYDDIWNTAVFVLMQTGILAHTDKENGILMAIGKPPFILYAERGDPVGVYIKWLDHLYRGTGKQERFTTLVFPPEVKVRLAESLFGKLSTELYASTKWTYLEKAARE